ncbi:hypothetical protein O181_096155 [Austropuccinia psidii MF-1]|uniref:Reverse transcriptase domain-containing protein n=1 Tax=Austropuccinia psidii MF-1 TaxID=1389203 RepID=A0A9Q3J564_9BASI|nr:hypothetical protein [Austropuccinia psidii MF-1]
MPFGLSNPPASFQNLLNDKFADFLDVFVVVYLEDIVAFSSSEEEHVKHVTPVLQMLRDNNLFAKASKCVFHASSVEYLGYVVESEGLKMDSSRVQQILNWPPPRNIKALQSFLEYLSQFQILTDALTTAPILAHFNASLPTIVETDASDYALGAVLSRVNDSGKHPIAFDSCKLLPAELNYEIHDKELLGIVWALKNWRAFLLSFSNPFEVLTDNSSLQYFMSSKFLTLCQAHWAEFLSEFHCTITYRPGRLANYQMPCHVRTTYGQTDRVNQILEQCLWMYVSYHQDYWHTWLPLAEFAYNNAEHSSTKKSPFFTIYGRNPSFDSNHVSQDSPAGKLSTSLQSVQQVVKKELESEIRRFKKYADRNRAIPPDFQPGDKVWLASKNIKTTRPTKKLSERWLGPFEVIKKIGSHAYHLKLAQQWKSVHPVFHVSLLEPVKQSAIPNQHQLPPPCNNHSPGVRVLINTPTQTTQISRSSICISIQFQQSSF